jgi:hypothetical protein
VVYDSSVPKPYEATTVVRRPRVALVWGIIASYVGLWAASIAATAALNLHSNFGVMLWWTAFPAIAALRSKTKVETMRVRASKEGLKLGRQFVPRSRFDSALLRWEGERSYVTLRGRSWRSRVDVGVRDASDADALCQALGLDAQSTTAEFSLYRHVPGIAAIAAILAACGVAIGFGVATHAGASAQAFMVLPVALVAFVLAFVTLFVLLRRVALHVGADGMVVREGIGRRRFHQHDQIVRVEATGRSIVMESKDGRTVRYDVGVQQRRQGKDVTFHEDSLQAAAVVWRIEKAREAYRALASGAAPQSALVLDRGGRPVRDWLDMLRRVGEGDGATFRNALLTREQLLGVVESTTAAAKERLAAAVALRASLTEEEKPRVRVAAERCVAPALGQRLVRVLNSPSDEELAAVLEEAERDAVS